MARLVTAGRWIRVMFAHNPAQVRYTVHGNDGTVSAAGTVKATAPAETQTAARTAPWAVQRRAVLVLHSTWRDGRWQPGPVEWQGARP